MPDLQSILHKAVSEFNSMYQEFVKATIVRFENNEIVVAIYSQDKEDKGGYNINEYADKVKQTMEKGLNTNIEVGEINDTGKSHIIRYIIKGKE